MPTQIRSMTFWLNAFIPGKIPGYTRTVPKGVHVGKTMIPGPHRPGIGGLRLEISDCYLTDQRSFSNNIHEKKSRVHSEFKIDFSGPRPVLTQRHNCGPTTELDCEDGDVECSKTGDTSRCSFTLMPTRGIGPLSVKMKCAASNPCAPSSRLFGDIDFEGSIIVDAAARSIDVDVKIDAFPAFEAYATINDGAGFALFEADPPAGNTVFNLPLGANRRVRRRVEDRDSDGRFETLTRF